MKSDKTQQENSLENDSIVVQCLIDSLSYHRRSWLISFVSLSNVVHLK